VMRGLRARGGRQRGVARHTSAAHRCRRPGTRHRTGGLRGARARDGSARGIPGELLAISGRRRRHALVPSSRPFQQRHCC
jgi:hypothetical protein